MPAAAAAGTVRSQRRPVGPGELQLPARSVTSRKDAKNAKKDDPRTGGEERVKGALRAGTGRPGGGGRFRHSEQGGQSPPCGFFSARRADSDARLLLLIWRPSCQWGKASPGPRLSANGQGSSVSGGRFGRPTEATAVSLIFAGRARRRVVPSRCLQSDVVLTARPWLHRRVGAVRSSMVARSTPSAQRARPMSGCIAAHKWPTSSRAMAVLATFVCLVMDSL